MENEPLNEFERNLKLLGTTSSWPDRSSRSAFGWAVTCIQNAADRWKRRHLIDDVPPDTTARQIEWCCPACGRVVLDDYVENSPGALSRLEELLGEYSKLRWEQLAYSAPAQQTSNPQTRDCNGPSSFRRWIASWVNALPQQSLPRHRADAGAVNDDDDDDPESCKDQRQKPGQTSSRHHSFVLLCIPFLRWGTKAHQPDVCAVRSDQGFFRLLCIAHAAYRTQYPWSWLRRVTLLRLVKFEMFRNRLVNISQFPFLPIGVEFDHEPADTEPPIGANLMMHLFENPDHADIFPVLFKRIPRKTRARLEA
ncbi:hypothetical protein LZ30DRAFT_335677 [Colletotrichum cereale]|nr:hypothetical protein LZ30DRAFT_335677 [Colletotrichum cereale]